MPQLVNLRPCFAPRSQLERFVLKLIICQLGERDDTCQNSVPCCQEPPSDKESANRSIPRPTRGDNDAIASSDADMRSQMEQVFRNLIAASKAAAATWANVVKASPCVTDSGEFQKLGDVRMRYFGVASTSTTVGPSSASPVLTSWSKSTLSPVIESETLRSGPLSRPRMVQKSMLKVRCSTMPYPLA